jgi:hypothetical protein
MAGGVADGEPRSVTHDGERVPGAAAGAAPVTPPVLGTARPARAAWASACLPAPAPGLVRATTAGASRTARRLVVPVCGSGAAARHTAGGRGYRRHVGADRMARWPDPHAGLSRLIPLHGAATIAVAGKAQCIRLRWIHMGVRVRVRIDVRMGYAEFVRMINADDTCGCPPAKPGQQCPAPLPGLLDPVEDEQAQAGGGNRRHCGRPATVHRDRTRRRAAAGNSSDCATRWWMAERNTRSAVCWRQRLRRAAGVVGRRQGSRM